jgi:16S rRNA (uracil1498-N3)-methyltransferase
LAVEDPLFFLVTACHAGLPDGSGGPHVLVDDVDVPTLADDDRHHVERVLRQGEGSTLTVTDGAGRWRPCRLTAQGLEATGVATSATRPTPRLTVAFAVTKGSKPELAVQKLTELGIDEIVVFEAERSVARWDRDKQERALTRLRRVAREALMQSRGVWLPEIEVGARFSELASRPSVALADRQGTPLDHTHTALMVGPEGGWSDRERSAVSGRVCLSPNVLRAETAAMTAGALMAASRAWGAQ